MSLGDLTEAVKAITKVLDLDQQNEDAYILYALIQTKQGNFAGA